MKATKLIALVSVLSLMGFGCSKSSTNAGQATSPVAVPPVVIDPTAPTGINTGGISYSTGSTATLNPVSLQTLTDYVATHPLNNPVNLKVNINLNQAEAGRYGGTVTISYTDNGITYAGQFNSGMGRNQSISGMYDNNALESNYNYWFKYQNQLVFTGFFEDQYGAITVTLIPETTTTTTGSDGEPTLATSYKGSIYYKNFLVQSNPYVGGATTGTMASHSPYRACWFTYRGPYDCRSNVIQTKCGLTPGAEAGYKLLGTFTGISTKAAFNIQ